MHLYIPLSNQHSFVLHQSEAGSHDQDNGCNNDYYATAVPRMSPRRLPTHNQ